MSKNIEEISKFASLFKRKHPHLQLFVLTDPSRSPNITALSKTLPESVHLIIRHYGRLNALNEIKNPKCKIIPSFDRQITKTHEFEGFHFPIERIKNIPKHKLKGKIFSVSVHNNRDIQIAMKKKAKHIILSKIFESKSTGKGKILGPIRLREIVRHFKRANFIALGGINRRNYKRIISTGIKGIAGVGFE